MFVGCSDKVSIFGSDFYIWRNAVFGELIALIVSRRSREEFPSICRSRRREWIV
jgi:hypothetical protein